MIARGDSIMVGLSGGKDSLLLTLALATIRIKSPFKFGLYALIIDQSNGTMETEPVRRFLNDLDIPLHLIVHPTYEIVKERNERSPCSFCANMRRGILAAHAKKNGCNVLALGHHKDDAAETVLLNLFYGGRFKCYHPNMYMTRSGVRVIRPFSYIGEDKIAIEAKRLSLPIASSCCPYGDKSKRKLAKEILADLTLRAPDLKNNIIHALQNVKENENWNKKELSGEEYAE